MTNYPWVLSTITGIREFCDSAELCSRRYNRSSSPPANIQGNFPYLTNLVVICKYFGLTDWFLILLGACVKHIKREPMYQVCYIFGVQEDVIHIRFYFIIFPSPFLRKLRERVLHGLPWQPNHPVLDDTLER